MPLAEHPVEPVHGIVLVDHTDAAGPQHARDFAQQRELILGMSYDDPAVRPLLDLEGLKEWRPGRLSGYAQLNRAVDRFGTLEPWLAGMRAG